MSEEVLAGADAHKCFYLYGAVRSRVSCFEEHALRLALATINRIANEQQKSITPLLCVQKNFYLRIFVRVDNKKKACWSSIEKTGVISYCTQCPNSYVERYGHFDEKKKTYVPNRVQLHSLKCDLCGGAWVMNGPLWLDPINNLEFMKNLNDNFDAVKRQDKKHPHWAHLKNLKVTKFEDINGLIKSIIQEEVVQNVPVTWDFTDLFGHVKVGAPKNTVI